MFSSNSPVLPQPWTPQPGFADTYGQTMQEVQHTYGDLDLDLNQDAVEMFKALQGENGAFQQPPTYHQTQPVHQGNQYIATTATDPDSAIASLMLIDDDNNMVEAHPAQTVSNAQASVLVAAHQLPLLILRNPFDMYIEIEEKAKQLVLIFDVTSGGSVTHSVGGYCTAQGMPYNRNLTGVSFRRMDNIKALDCDFGINGSVNDFFNIVRSSGLSVRLFVKATEVYRGHVDYNNDKNQGQEPRFQQLAADHFILNGQTQPSPAEFSFVDTGLGVYRRNIAETVTMAINNSAMTDGRSGGRQIPIRRVKAVLCLQIDNGQVMQLATVYGSLQLALIVWKDVQRLANPPAVAPVRR